MGSNIQLRKNGPRIDNVYRCRLSSLQGNSKIINVRQPHPENRHAQAKDGYKKFNEQFGKFLESKMHEDSTSRTRYIELVRFSNSKSGDELNRLKCAQCVENGWWLSRNDCAGEALAQNECRTNDRRLKIGST